MGDKISVIFQNIIIYFGVVVLSYLYAVPVINFRSTVLWTHCCFTND